MKGGSVNRAREVSRLSGYLRATPEEPRKKMEEDEQEERRRKVEAGRAKVASFSPLCCGEKSSGCSGAQTAAWPKPVVAEQWEPPSACPSRRFCGIHFLAAAILNPPPSVSPRPAAAAANQRRRRAMLVGGPSAVGGFWSPSIPRCCASGARGRTVQGFLKKLPSDLVFPEPRTSASQWCPGAVSSCSLSGRALQLRYF